MRVALQLVLAICAIAIAAALSVGVIHVIERPVSPFEPVSEQERHAFRPVEPEVAPVPVDQLEPASAPDLPTSD